MRDYRAFFAGKTVTQMGLGLLGRGVGDAAFLARHCAHVDITDMKSAEELKASVDALKDHKNIAFHLGRHPDHLFQQVDFVLKGAGIRLDNPCLRLTAESGDPVYMSSALFALFCPIPIIGVTGTRGKTTTTMMIADILQRAGKRVLLGGNIRGVSTLALLPEADHYDIAVLELDSWQLQGFDTLGLSPHIGVFTNFYPDHLNYYDGDMQRYLQDKTAIFRHQKPGDRLIVSPQVAGLIKDVPKPHAIMRIVDQPPPYLLQIPGAHNLTNAALAAEAAKACGVAPEIIMAALQAFTGVEGRLQRVGAWDGRVFYNDSNATTQEATLAALHAFPADKTVLIFGGADKGLPIDHLIRTIEHRGTRCVLLTGSGSDRVLAELPQIPVAGSMAQAVAQAKALSRPGDTIVLSPAFASFGLFKNEYDRSDQFLAEVAQLTRQAGS